MTIATKNQMRVMGRGGDTKIEWDPDKKKEVAEAKRTFESLIKEGYKAFLICDEGNKGSQMDKFDPEAERILMVAPIVGG